MRTECTPQSGTATIGTRWRGEQRSSTDKPYNKNMRKEKGNSRSWQQTERNGRRAKPAAIIPPLSTLLLPLIRALRKASVHRVWSLLPLCRCLVCPVCWRAGPSLVRCSCAWPCWTTSFGCYCSGPSRPNSSTSRPNGTSRKTNGTAIVSTNKANNKTTTTANSSSNARRARPSAIDVLRFTQLRNSSFYFRIMIEKLNVWRMKHVSASTPAQFTAQCQSSSDDSSHFRLRLSC